MKIGYVITLAFMIISSGCSLAEITDVPKTIWGSSMRVLEQSRSNALVKVYDKDYWICVKAVKSVIHKKKYVLFKKDEVENGDGDYNAHESYSTKRKWAVR